MKLTDLVIDKSSLGNRLWLVEIVPSYEYKDGKRTDTVSGHRYVVAMPDRGLEKVSVKIEGKKLMEAPEGYAEVTFDDLEVFIYWMNGQHHVGVRAKGIALVKPKA